MAGSADLLILLNPNETFDSFHKRYYVCRTVITSLHSCILTKRSQDLRRRSISLRLPKSVPLGLWLTKRDYANVSYRSKVVSASSVLVGLCYPDDRSFMCGLFYKKKVGFMFVVFSFEMASCGSKIRFTMSSVQTFSAFFYSCSVVLSAFELS